MGNGFVHEDAVAKAPDLNQQHVDVMFVELPAAPDSKAPALRASVAAAAAQEELEDNVKDAPSGIASDNVPAAAPVVVAAAAPAPAPASAPTPAAASPSPSP